MAWKGVKCENCHRDLGCPHCGQILPDLSTVSEDYENFIGEEVVAFFCTSKCRDEWKEKRKALLERRSHT